MKVLVTGASGFLGGWIAQRLSERGVKVRALVRKTSNRKHLETLEHVEFAEGTVEDLASVAAAAEGITAVVHCAALVKARNQAEYDRTNVEGTRNLVRATRGQKLKRFVMVSSLEAAGPSKDGGPVAPEQEEPITAYGRSKLAAEKVALEAKDEVPVTILRPGAIYGPRDQEIFDLFLNINRGLMPTIRNGVQRGVFIYAADCAEAVVQAIDADVPSGSVFFVDDGHPISYRELFEFIEQALGKKALIRFNLPVGLLKVVSHGVQALGKLTNRAVMLTPEKANMLMQHWVAESAPTRLALGWTPTLKVEQGVHHAVKWYRENGWL